MVHFIPGDMTEKTETMACLGQMHSIVSETFTI